LSTPPERLLVELLVGLERTALQRLRELSSLAELEQAA
jgi:hypothetical protein